MGIVNGESVEGGFTTSVIAGSKRGAGSSLPLHARGNGFIDEDMLGSESIITGAFSRCSAHEEAISGTG
jgi:hypothetical protein